MGYPTHMWTAKETAISATQQHTRLLSEQRVLTYSEVLELWENSREFREFWNSHLTQLPWPGYRWETPAVTENTLDREFECVLLRSDALDRGLDRESFREHFEPDKAVVVFENLGADATLVAPCPCDDLECYGHLARFMQEAPPEQVHELWQTVARTLRKKIGAEPIWLSTAGGGVSWLHVRLDSHPKYYGYEPFTAT